MTLSLHSTCHYNTWTSYLKTHGYHTAFKMSWIKNIFFVVFFRAQASPSTNKWMIWWDTAFLVRRFWIPLQRDFYEPRRAFTVVWKIFTESTRSWSHPHVLLPTPMCIWINHRPMRTMVSASKSSLPLTFKAASEEGRKEAASELWKSESCILPFCSHSMWQQHEMPQFLHKSGKETAFVSHLNLDSHPFTSQVPPLGLPFVWSQMSNRNRKQRLQCPFSGVLPVAQDVGFDKKRISEYKEIPKFSFICFGIFLPTSNSCVITWAFARTTCCLTPTLNEKASTC